MSELPKIRPLHKQDKRKRNKHVIISHIGNFSVRLDPMIPTLRGYMSTNTMALQDNYFRNKLERNVLPFHFLVTRANNNWYVGVSAPLNVKSDLITKAISAGYMSSIYEDAIVIAIQDDFTTRIPDPKIYEAVGANIIAPLKELLRLGSVTDTVFFFDEVFDIAKYESDFNTNQHIIKYPYAVKPMRYFDRVDFNLEVRRFA